jgi:energy-converting hydrogenase Eha subunit G
VGILQAILQAMLQGAGPVGYCLKVLKGVISAGCCARCLVGVLFLDPRSWVLYLLLAGRFGRFIPLGGRFSWFLVPGYCACCLLGVLFLDPRSWILCLLLAGRFTPRSWRFVPGSSFRS